MDGHPTGSLRSAGFGPAWTLILGVTLLLGWMIWQQGSYFDGDFYPAAIALILLLAVLIVVAPFPGRLRGPACWALVALGLLAVWTLLSGIWSDVPSAGPAYAARVFVYAAFFFIGIWVVLLLRERMTDVLFVLSAAGLAVGLGTVFVIATGDDSQWYVHLDATLRFPIGYRNANAALFLCCLWPMLALAAENGRHWALRAAAVAGGTMMIELALLAQSRGSMPATIVAVVVFIAVIPHRLRAASLLGLTVIPVVIAAPTLLEVFRYGNDDAAVLGLLRDAAKVILLTSALSFALAAFALVAVYPKLNLGARRVSLISWAGLAIVAVVAVVGASAFVAKHGGPIKFVDQRVEEFTSIGYPDLREQGVRYGANVGSNRGDFWRVSLDRWRESPVIGTGAGSFEPGYLKERRSWESPQDPHSAEMLILAEQGAVGIGLFLAFLVAAAWAAVKSRALGARAGLLGAAALAAAAQWLLPASYDWFWQYAGVTAPAFFMLGAAAAPALIDPTAQQRRGLRLAGAALCVLLALAMFPAYLADRYLARGDDLRADNPTAALADYRRSANLSPWSVVALVRAANLELANGRAEQALTLARQALDRQDQDYSANLAYTQALIALDSAQAPDWVERLEELSPLAQEIEVLREKIKG